MIDYINNYDYLIDNLEDLHLSHQELLVLLVIENFNKRGRSTEISTTILARKLQLKKEEVVQILTSLKEKHHLLKMDAVDSKFFLTIDVQRVENNISSSIIQLVEKLCGRDLSYQEIKRLETWQCRYSQESIIYTLRDIKDSTGLNFNLIENILESKQGGK